MAPEKALGFIAVLLACCAIKAGCVAMSIWLDKAAPAFAARALHAYQARGLRSFLLGAVNGIALLILFGAMANGMAVFKLIGLLILFTLIAAAMTGYMIAYHDIGRRLRGERDWSSTRTILIGGLTAEAAFLAPVIGQIFSIGVLFRGLGAVISALLWRGSAVSASPGGPA